MEKKVMALFTVSPLHIGAGSSVGVVDLPIMRERHTRIPVIPGSSLKGVLAALWSGDCEKKGKEIVRPKDSEAEFLFGGQDDKVAKAGNLVVGEARVVLFPVRSLKGGFAWITSPLALSRLKRDLEGAPDVPELMGDVCLAAQGVVIGDAVVLEEYKVTASSKAGFPSNWCDCLRTLMPEEVVSLMQDRLVLVSDDIFFHFCEQACQVVTRIKVDDESGTVVAGALFTQEQVPSESLFTTSVSGLKKDVLAKLEAKLKSDPVRHTIQVGGDETTGLGICKVKLV